MEIFVYEGQNGKQLYPKKSNHIEDYIYKQFFNNIILDLNRKGNKLEITCFVVARDGARIEGYYIKFIDNYSHNYFENFKNQTDCVFSELKFEPMREDKRNAIFNNIKKIDQYQLNNNWDIDIHYAFDNRNDTLEYIGGNVNEIAIFCNNTLRQLSNLNIVISFNKCNFGNFNISVENHEGNLQRTQNTNEKLKKHAQKIKKLQNQTIINNAKQKIKSGIDDLINVRISNQEVIQILKKIMSSRGLEISPNQKDSPRYESKSINKRKTTGLSGYESRSINKRKTTGLSGYESIEKITGSTVTSNSDDNNLKKIATKRKRSWPIKTIAIILFIIVIYLFINPSIISSYTNGNIFVTQNNTSTSNLKNESIIMIDNNKFVPNTIEIPIKQKVIWQNNDDISYNLISQNKLWDEPYPLNKGDRKEQYFNTSGIFNFSLDTNDKLGVSNTLQIKVQ